MASTIRRFQISSDTFAIKNGWLQLDGPSIRIDSITSLSVARNRDDIWREYEAAKKFAQKEDARRRPLGIILMIFVITSSITSCSAAWGASTPFIGPHFEQIKK